MTPFPPRDPTNELGAAEFLLRSGAPARQAHSAAAPAAPAAPSAPDRAEWELRPRDPRRPFTGSAGLLELPPGRQSEEGTLLVLRVAIGFQSSGRSASGRPSFRLKPLLEVRREIRWARAHLGEITRVTLADARVRWAPGAYVRAVYEAVRQGLSTPARLDRLVRLGRLPPEWESA